jgi:hypothetical protein
MSRLGIAVRLLLLAAAAYFSLASAQQSQDTRAPSYSEYQAAGQPPSGTSGRRAEPPGPVYTCFGLRTGNTASSLCFGSHERCETERAQASRDGSSTGACRPLAPVSCFQLGGDPNPSMEVCAETAKDCDLWRLVDQDKNGVTGPGCEWRHWMARR